ncbi:MAG: hypothetical protein M1833_003949 [Piccolia ochrophora]|nr:MAG: hypothetical protein M1833_003949 [Piccolia ochrophora]
MTRRQPPLSSLLPPLVCGTATFNSQYNPDPYALPTTAIVHRALAQGIRAFDTSPYYGPAEELLGQALLAPLPQGSVSREDYFLLTKIGRISSTEFDYSPEWIQQSVQRSLVRLKTSYLDVVYCHDVEFVSPEEVLQAVIELRRIRDETEAIRYIGISGYPVALVCERAEMILEKTGEPLDAVMSYANFTLQNSTLASEGVHRLKAAGVDVVANGSPLGMGLLRGEGVPIGSQGDFHPANDELREACQKASKFCNTHGEKLEVVALRYALEAWLNEGESVGTTGDPASGVPSDQTKRELRKMKLGVSVIGVSFVEELDKTLQVWRSILDGLDDGEYTAVAAGRHRDDHQWSLNRRKVVAEIVLGVRESLGQWVDYAWPSPGPGFVRQNHRPSDIHGGYATDLSPQRLVASSFTESSDVQRSSHL